MRVLVTGGAGYVGSHAAKRLAESGHHVIIVDNMAEGHRPAAGRLSLVVADLLDRESIVAALREHKIDAVMHFAAFAYVGVSVREPAVYYQNNIVGSLALLDAMRAAGVNRIVFSSSCATYGIPERVPITEDHSQNPIAALRYFNASGAAADGSIGEDHDPETHLIPLVLQVALGQRECVEIFGTDYPTPDGTCIRDYIHVDDLATAHVAALEKLEAGAQLKLNLGTGHGASVREVIDLCREVTGHPIPTRAVARREGDPPALVADVSAAKRTLGWQARYSMREIVESAWAWHKKHPRGYDTD
jgi:UDP-glucose 4-epimerase